MKQHLPPHGSRSFCTRWDASGGWRHKGVRWNSGKRLINGRLDAPSALGLINRSTVAQTPGSADTTPGAYFPGTGLSPDATLPVQRLSPYFPGTATFSRATELAEQIAPLPASHDWTAAAQLAERTTTAQWRNQNVGQVIQSGIEMGNTLSSRVQALDVRDRANHNVAQSALMLAGATTVDFTTLSPFSAQPTSVQATSGTNGWTPAFSVHCPSGAANADGTWTMTVTADIAAPIGGGVVTLDVKGPVSTSMDIDP